MIGARRRRSDRCVVAGLAIALASGACTTTQEREDKVAPEEEPPVDEAPAAGTFHEVKAGDTLTAIARRHQVSVEDILEVNGLEKPDELAVGQVLFIPDDGLALPKDAAPEEIDEAPAPLASSSMLAWPLDEGIILRDFDRSRAHDGITLAAPLGTPVRAAADGEVVFVGDEGKTYGRMVMIRHADTLLTIYAHLGRFDVERGAKVRVRDVIGAVGESGRAESPQLHFQVRRGREPENPLSHLAPAE